MRGRQRGVVNRSGGGCVSGIRRAEGKKENGAAARVDGFRRDEGVKKQRLRKEVPSVLGWTDKEKEMKASGWGCCSDQYQSSERGWEKHIWFSTEPREERKRTQKRR
ncbi:unnamed protein product [Lactuca virosa]|uniref:Uncharacterized protein n=1 Tax=Lactuca virosa TaxID=75947 RepID=A0AAU9M295_9ASTR|nr:unnamed protein product [Lactuca virosa]